MIAVTPLEMRVIELLVNNEFSSEGHGFCGYIYHDENNMNVMRGAMASLVKKGIVYDWDTETADNATWGSLTDLVSEPAPGLHSPDPFAEYGFILKNLEVIE